MIKREKNNVEYNESVEPWRHCYTIGGISMKFQEAPYFLAIVALFKIAPI